MKRTIWFFVSVCSIFIQILSAQGELVEIPLEQQIFNSDYIVEGKVTSKSSHWNDNYSRIYTVNTIKVYKAFKGFTEEYIDVLTLGGTVGDMSLVVTPNLELKEGETGVFMLNKDNLDLIDRKTPYDMFKAYSGIQGFYKYDNVTDKVANVFKKFNGISSSFYEDVKDITKTEFIQISGESFTENKTRKSKLIPFISSFSPTTANAGTGEEITITGFTFGNTQGTVEFSDANDGGSTFVAALDSEITNWTDNSITVRVPSRAGTGVIRVIASGNGGASTSSASLTVPYALLNSNGFVRQHIDEDDSDGVQGYIWKMSSDFNNSVAKAAALRAFETWICATNVNWVISDDTTFSSSFSLDGVNVIAFDTPGDELDAGVLGAALGWTSGCSTGRVITEIDIVFDDERGNWNFSEAPASSGEFDFETVFLHELGHGHALAHIISPGSLMHFAVSPGSTVRTLAANDIDAGNFLHNLSVNSPQCGRDPMTSLTCASLTLNDNEFNEAITIVPNPASETIRIHNHSVLPITKISILDTKGRLIKLLELPNIIGRAVTLNLNNLAKGLYVVKIDSGNSTSSSKKLMVQ